jgi:hypothetical protein
MACSTRWLASVVLVVACYEGPGAGGSPEAGSDGTDGASSSGAADGSTPGGSGGTRATDDPTTADDTGTVDEGPSSGTSPVPSPDGLLAIAANETVGLDWNAVEGADAYRIHWSDAPGVTPGDAQAIDVADPGEVHRALANGTTLYYVVTAIAGGEESDPSAEVEATPGGEWALEELGHGVVDDILTGAQTAKVPLSARNHVLLFAEGYTQADLATFHDHADHGGARDNDVDAWVDLVFSIEPYMTFRENFVVWTIPRASATDINASSPDTAWAVPVDVSTSFPGTQSIPSDGETAARAWAALADHPVAPTDFADGGFGNVRTHTAAFLIYDPDAGHASVSGRATSLRNPMDDSQRLSSAFGVGHAHEFTHAFAALRDEYLENDNSPPSYSLTSNVTDTSACGELPWQHLLVGEGINDAAELVGAFGVSQIGFHAELLCLMNGTHDNAQYYGGDGLLRVEDRMCNFCREITAYRVFQRGGVLDGDDAFDTWVAQYRDAFYDRFGFAVPDPVPQTNDVGDPGSGTPVYEGCTAAAPLRPAVTLPGAGDHGCLPAEL